MGRSKGKPQYTLADRERIAKAVCEAYRNGNDIVSSCAAHGITYRSFYYWKAKYESVRKIHDEALRELNETKYDLLRSLSEAALIKNLQTNIIVRETTIEEPMIIRDKFGNVMYDDEGVPKFKMIKKTIIERKTNLPSVAAAIKSLEKLDPKFKKDAEEDMPTDQRAIAEKMEKRQRILEEKLRQMRGEKGDEVE